MQRYGMSVPDDCNHRTPLTMRARRCSFLALLFSSPPSTIALMQPARLVFAAAASTPEFFAKIIMGPVLAQVRSGEPPVLCPFWILSFTLTSACHVPAAGHETCLSR